MGQAFKRDQLSEEDRNQFKAANTVHGTFNNYITWLYGRKFDPNVVQMEILYNAKGVVFVS